MVIIHHPGETERETLKWLRFERYPLLFGTPTPTFVKYLGPFALLRPQLLLALPL